MKSSVYHPSHFLCLSLPIYSNSKGAIVLSNAWGCTRFGWSWILPRAVLLNCLSYRSCDSGVVGNASFAKHLNPICRVGDDNGLSSWLDVLLHYLETSCDPTWSLDEAVHLNNQVSPSRQLSSFPSLLIFPVNGKSFAHCLESFWREELVFS